VRHVTVVIVLFDH